MRRILSTVALLTLTSLAACGNSDPSGPAGAPTIVSGEVTHIVNLVPVDGGVLIDVAVSESAMDRLIFPSLFTEPPPDNETMQLYDVVRRVEVGDVVRAQGTRTATGLLLEELWILDGRP